MVYIPKNIIHKKCKYCGKKFKIRSANQLFCSHNCFKINRNTNPERKKWLADYAKTPARKKRRSEIATLPKNKKKKKSYMKGYRQRPKVKKKRMEEAKLPENIAWKNNYNKTVLPKRRKEVIRDLGGKCFVCGTNKRLEFHHIKYTRSSKLNWNEVEAKEHPENFRLLCHKCHNVVTYVLHEPKRTILVLTNLQKIL
jgi:endogenous inhibitor of DNA gyrase (YacG/DUF329 family)